ncbi:MAG: hypothetical protein DRN95_08140, partial [Candidatus Hydrothermarchaeota archaeon]
RGKPDNLFGNLVIEFEANLRQESERKEAEKQLRLYVAILWTHDKKAGQELTPYICLATDGVRFQTYVPTVEDPNASEFTPDDIRLKKSEYHDWSTVKVDEVLYWLDRYFLRQQILKPTSERMVTDFGPQSPAYLAISDLLLNAWQKVKNKSEYAVLYDNWDRYLRIVYGASVGGDDLFVRHTYLATVAKIMAYIRVMNASSIYGRQEIVDLLTGHIFEGARVKNFLEEDFFSWLGREECADTGVKVVRRLFSILSKYDLAYLSEDVLKSLYEELVDPAERHDLGEYYTPDWLAHRMLNKLLDENPKGSILDPACGSGTFLYLAITEKRRRLGDSPETLQHILESVYGMDVHPLAVIIAKTNYLLALGELLQHEHRKSPHGKHASKTIVLPVYLANAIRLPEPPQKGQLAFGAKCYRFRLEQGRFVEIPESALSSMSKYDRIVGLLRQFAESHKGGKISRESFQNFLRNRRVKEAEDPESSYALYYSVCVLKELMDKNRDTIWAFILKNAYKPHLLKHRFDFLVGNPPWLSYRHTSREYQHFLKEQITTAYKLLRERGELVTHFELATLFFVKSADLYLKQGGRIAFVLPKSVFSADHHHAFRNASFQLQESKGALIKYIGLWDCEGVSPLFKQSACVVFGEKASAVADDKIPGQILKGQLPRKNASLKDASRSLAVQDTDFFLYNVGERSCWAQADVELRGLNILQKESFYKDKFFEGANMVPRSLWFVQLTPLAEKLGFDPLSPEVETSQHAIKSAKPDYRDTKMHGRAEPDFL